MKRHTMIRSQHRRLRTLQGLRGVRVGRGCLAVALALGALTGCARRQAGPEADLALADTLRDVIADAYAFERPDVLSLMGSLYPDSGVVVSASGGRVVASADSIRSGIASFWTRAGSSMRSARWVWGDVYVDRLSRDAAVLTGTWSIPHIAPAGNEHVLTGAWTAVFRRVSGEWKIVHEHLSSPD